MNIVVIGGTGMAGAAITAEALHRGHHVTVAARTPHAVPGAVPAVLDLAGPDASTRLGDVVTGADAVVMAVRFPPGAERQVVPATRRVLEAAAACGVRVLVVGGAAVLASPTLPGVLVLDDPRWVPAAWRDIARASLDQYDACHTHPHVDWTYVSPAAVFEPGPATGGYVRGTTTLLLDGAGSSRLTPADLAQAVLDEVEGPAGDRHFTVRSLSPQEH